jgi:hypothetical protein
MKLEDLKSLNLSKRLQIQVPIVCLPLLTEIEDPLALIHRVYQRGLQIVTNAWDQSKWNSLIGWYQVELQKYSEQQANYVYSPFTGWDIPNLEQIPPRNSPASSQEAVAQNQTKNSVELWPISVTIVGVDTKKIVLRISIDPQKTFAGIYLDKLDNNLFRNYTYSYSQIDQERIFKLKRKWQSCKYSNYILGSEMDDLITTKRTRSCRN